MEVEDVIKMMSIAMIGDEPSKYLDDLKAILRLFDELDKYKDVFENYKPLYHPLESRGLPRPDKPIDSYVDLREVCGSSLYEGYVSLPPIKGVRRLGRERG